MQRRHTVLNRRRFCGLAAGLPLAAVMPSAQAETPDTDYEAGTNLLKSGRDYLKAIAALERAVQAKPGSAAYHSALGCAYAARFASLCYGIGSVGYAEVARRNYESDKAHWDAAQKQPRNPRGDRPPPVPPQPAATPDDDVPIALGRKSVAGYDGETTFYVVAANSARETARQMGGKSVVAFETAHRLALRLPAGERATIEFERGWGQLFLWLAIQQSDLFYENGGRGAPDTPPPFGLSARVLIEPFDVCVRADGENADYWHSLAVAQVPRYGLLTGEANYPEAVRQSALAAYDRAIALRPGDWNVRVQAAIAMGKTLGPTVAADRLEQAARRIGNTVLWQLVAGKRFSVAPIPFGRDPLSEKVLAAIEQGGRAANYEKVSFRFPIPPLLQIIWKNGSSKIDENLQYLERLYDPAEIFDHLPMLQDGAEAEKIALHTATVFVNAQAIQLKKVLMLRVGKSEPYSIAAEQFDNVIGVLSLIRGWCEAEQRERPTEQKARLLREVRLLEKQSGHYVTLEYTPSF